MYNLIIMNLKNINDFEDFKFIYDDMLQQFPKCELKSFEHIKSLFKTNKYKIAVFEDNNEIKGYILYYLSDFIWVDYFAIFKDFHSKGFGTLILNQSFEKYKNLKCVYFEVEKEDKKDINTTKRLNFYKRLGCFDSNIKYFLPNEIYNDYEMKLLYKPLSVQNINRNLILNHIEESFKVLYSNIKNVNLVFDKIKHHC